MARGEPSVICQYSGRPMPALTPSGSGMGGDGRFSIVQWSVSQLVKSMLNFDSCSLDLTAPDSFFFCFFLLPGASTLHDAPN